MAREEVINYVMDNPGNTNPAVLSGLLGEDGIDVRLLKVNFEPLEETSDKRYFKCSKTFSELADLVSKGFIPYTDISKVPVPQDFLPEEFQLYYCSPLTNIYYVDARRVDGDVNCYLSFYLSGNVVTFYFESWDSDACYSNKTTEG